MRYFNPKQGRFISNDPWQGTPSQPSSLNSWLYAYANPVNRFDPSGLCPDIDDDGECDPGWRCWLIENPEVRRICIDSFCDKNIRMAPGCPAPTHKKAYYNGKGGELFVELLKQCPGWWHDDTWFDMYNNNDIERLALSFEVLWESNKVFYGDHFQAFIEAISHKYWQMRRSFPGKGLPWTLGGSESVISRVNKHHDGSQPFDKRSDTSLNGWFLLALKYVDGYIFGKYFDQHGGSWKYQTRPYEWGNPPGIHPILIGRNKGVCPGEVYSINYGRKVVQPGDMCVLTFHQERCITEPEDWEEVCTLNCEDYKEKWLP
jgi:hypothetical protein